jgi:hypothetical protein
VVRVGRDIRIVLTEAVGAIRRRLLLGPSQESVERRAERLSPPGQVVLHLRWDLRMHNPRHDTVLLQLPKLLGQHLLRDAGIARSKSEKRSVLPPKRWKRMTSFQRPSSLRMACSIPAAADAGVCARLLTGASLTFACALAASAGPGM